MVAVVTADRTRDAVARLGREEEELHLLLDTDQYHWHQQDGI